MALAGAYLVFSRGARSRATGSGKAAGTVGTGTSTVEAPAAPETPEHRTQPETTTLAAAAAPPPAGKRFEPLSERELEVLQLLATGRSNREIAGELYVATGTVKAHLNNIFRKLEARSRLEAVTRARELRLLASATPNKPPKPAGLAIWPMLAMGWQP